LRRIYRNLDSIFQIVHRNEDITGNPNSASINKESLDLHKITVL